jgi:hypothetical protein
MQEHQEALRRSQEAEQKLERRDRETYDEIPGSPAVEVGVARVAIQGRELMVENSFPNAGSENTDPKQCEVGLHQGPTSSGPEHSRSRLRRKGRMPTTKRLTLDIPGKVM